MCCRERHHSYEPKRLPLAEPVKAEDYGDGGDAFAARTKAAAVEAVSAALNDGKSKPPSKGYLLINVMIITAAMLAGMRVCVWGGVCV